MPRPEPKWPAVLEAIKACPDPMGATHAWLTEHTGLGNRAVTMALHKLTTRLETVFVLRHPSRYFASVEARAAAGILMKHAAEEARARKQYRQPGVTDAVLAELRASTEPMGITRRALRIKIDAAHMTVWKATHRLLVSGQIFSLGSSTGERLFATAAARDAAAPVFAKAEAEARVARKRARQARRQERAAAKRPPKPVKVAKAPTPAVPKPQKQWVQAPVQMRKAPKTNFKDLPAIVPPGVKVMKCPGYTPRTFAPPSWFKGELTREWQQLRAEPGTGQQARMQPAEAA
jgi:hypothetical protein